jgi:hypothetical protein
MSFLFFKKCFLLLVGTAAFFATHFGDNLKIYMVRLDVGCELVSEKNSKSNGQQRKHTES